MKKNTDGFKSKAEQSGAEVASDASISVDACADVGIGAEAQADDGARGSLDLIKRFGDFVSSNGLFFTKQRRTIAQVLIDTVGHPDVDLIYLETKKIYRNISVATVYRAINLFLELGLITKLQVCGSKSRYEVLDPHSSHEHIFDLDSGSVVEFSSKDIDEKLREISENAGYEIVRQDIRLYCKKKHKQ